MYHRSSGCTLYLVLCTLFFVFAGPVTLYTLRFTNYAHAAIPKLINFQGRLSNPDGSTKSDADYSMVFEIHDQEVIPGVKWSSGSLVVPVRGGVFSVTLGKDPQPPLVLPFDQDYWVRVVIGGEALVPKYRLTSSPYAMNAERLGGYATSEFILRSENNALAFNVRLEGDRYLLTRPMGSLLLSEEMGLRLYQFTLDPKRETRKTFAGTDLADYLIWSVDPSGKIQYRPSGVIKVEPQSTPRGIWVDQSLVGKDSLVFLTIQNAEESAVSVSISTKVPGKGFSFLVSPTSRELEVAYFIIN